MLYILYFSVSIYILSYLQWLTSQQQHVFFIYYLAAKYSVLYVTITIIFTMCVCIYTGYIYIYIYIYMYISTVHEATGK